jgi:L-iditol 2-dehydrogenase
MLGVERARLEPGQTVVVFGHGPLGCLLAMVAASRKCRVIVVGKAGWRLARVRALGVAECLDATASADVVADLRAMTDGRGAEVTIDATGRPEVWEQAMAAVGRGGSVVFFGGCAPGTSVKVDTRRAHYEELTLVGAFHHTPELIRRAVEALEAGVVNPDGLVTHTMGLARVRQALELMASGEALKVLIEP